MPSRIVRSPSRKPSPAENLRWTDDLTDEQHRGHRAQHPRRTERNTPSLKLCCERVVLGVLLFPHVNKPLDTRLFEEKFRQSPLARDPTQMGCNEGRDAVGGTTSFLEVAKHGRVVVRQRTDEKSRRQALLRPEVMEEAAVRRPCGGTDCCHSCGFESRRIERFNAGIEKCFAGIQCV